MPERETPEPARNPTDAAEKRGNGKGNGEPKTLESLQEDFKIDLAEYQVLPEIFEKPRAGQRRAELAQQLRADDLAARSGESPEEVRAKVQHKKMDSKYKAAAHLIYQRETAKSAKKPVGPAEEVPAAEERPAAEHAEEETPDIVEPEKKADADPLEKVPADHRDALQAILGDDVKLQERAYELALNTAEQRASEAHTAKLEKWEATRAERQKAAVESVGGYRPTLSSEEENRVATMSDTARARYMNRVRAQHHRKIQLATGPKPVPEPIDLTPDMVQAAAEIVKEEDLEARTALLKETIGLLEERDLEALRRLVGAPEAPAQPERSDKSVNEIRQELNARIESLSDEQRAELREKIGLDADEVITLAASEIHDARENITDFSDSALIQGLLHLHYDLQLERERAARAQEAPVEPQPVDLRAQAAERLELMDEEDLAQMRAEIGDDLAEALTLAAERLHAKGLHIGEISDITLTNEIYSARYHLQAEREDKQVSNLEVVPAELEGVHKDVLDRFEGLDAAVKNSISGHFGEYLKATLVELAAQLDDEEEDPARMREGKFIDKLYEANEAVQRRVQDSGTVEPSDGNSRIDVTAALDAEALSRAEARFDLLDRDVQDVVYKAVEDRRDHAALVAQRMSESLESRGWTLQQLHPDEIEQEVAQAKFELRREGKLPMDSDERATEPVMLSERAEEALAGLVADDQDRKRELVDRASRIREAEGSGRLITYDHIRRANDLVQWAPEQEVALRRPPAADADVTLQPRQSQGEPQARSASTRPESARDAGIRKAKEAGEWLRSRVSRSEKNTKPVRRRIVESRVGQRTIGFLDGVADRTDRQRK